MFVRSLLTVSLSCILTNIAFATTPVENSSTPASTVQVQDPIDPLAIDTQATINDPASAPQTSTPSKDQTAINSPASAPQTSTSSSTKAATSGNGIISTKDAKDLQQASNTLNNLQKTENSNAAIGTSAEGSKPVKIDWNLDTLNNAEWVENLGKGQLPVYARAHVMLNNAHASPGAIDGMSGKNTLKAIASFQQMNGLPATGELTKETWDALLAKQQNKSAFIEYTITEEDLKGPYAPSIPSDYALQAKMKGLYYVRVTEMLGEKFHIDETFLKKINPKATFKTVGEKIIVPNVRNDLPEDIHLIIAHKGAKQLYLFNSKNQMIASFPATIGSTDTPSPTGTYKVTGVAKNPWYSYSPSNFIQGNNLKPLSLPPGPNAPVGNIWIGLSKKSFGIHGTPSPSLISKTASHGCIRLTNWDANDLGDRVRAGVTVKFLE